MVIFLLGQIDGFLVDCAHAYTLNMHQSTSICRVNKRIMSCNYYPNTPKYYVLMSNAVSVQ